MSQPEALRDQTNSKIKVEQYIAMRAVTQLAVKAAYKGLLQNPLNHTEKQLSTEP